MALSPMMQQYLRIKEQYPDTILFFRLGDFYEMFFDDAKLVSQELELTLTGKECGLSERAPMCGVPYHAVETYLQKLIEKGHKVAICEQMTDPALAKGLVERRAKSVYKSTADRFRGAFSHAAKVHDFKKTKLQEFHAAQHSGPWPILGGMHALFSKRRDSAYARKR